MLVLRGATAKKFNFGTKAGIYKEDGDDFDIYVRFNEDNRYDKSALFNQKITFRDMASGQIKKSQFQRLQNIKLIVSVPSNTKMPKEWLPFIRL